MSLNKIELKTHMLAQLYPKNLVQTIAKNPPRLATENAENKVASSMPETKAVKFLGNNQKNILIIVSHRSVAFLPDEELSFLSNVLAACKLSLSDIAVVNAERLDADALSNFINTSAERVILFALQPLAIGLPINFPEFQLQQFNKRTYIHAPALAEIQNDKALKAKLWNALKPLFGI